MWRATLLTSPASASPKKFDLEVTEGVLNALDVRPLLGRVFRLRRFAHSREDGVLNYGYWRSRFGGDPSILGRRIVLDGEAREIIGVLPEGFRFLDRKFSLVLPLRSIRQRCLSAISVSTARASEARRFARRGERGCRTDDSDRAQRYPAFPGYNAKMFEEARLSPRSGRSRPSSSATSAKCSGYSWEPSAMVLLIACAKSRTCCSFAPRAGSRSWRFARLGRGRARLRAS